MRERRTVDGRLPGAVGALELGDRVPEGGRNLRIEVADTTSPTILTLTGEIDISTSGRVREALIAISNSGENKVVVDMTNVTFLDSTGLAALVGPLKRFRSMNGEIVLRSPTQGVQKVLEITGLTRVFTVESSQL